MLSFTHNNRHYLFYIISTFVHLLLCMNVILYFICMSSEELKFLSSSRSTPSPSAPKAGALDGTALLTGGEQCLKVLIYSSMSYT